jgi:hypothetical protein
MDLSNQSLKQGGKIDFWLTVSEVSVCGGLAPLFLGHGEAEHHGKGTRWSKVAYLILARKQRKRESGRYQGQSTLQISRPTSNQALPPTTFH